MNHNLPFIIDDYTLNCIVNDLKSIMIYSKDDNSILGLVVALCRGSNSSCSENNSSDKLCIDTDWSEEIIACTYDREVLVTDEFNDYHVDDIRLIIFKEAVEESLFGSRVVFEKINDKSASYDGDRSYIYRILPNIDSSCSITRPEL